MALSTEQYADALSEFVDICNTGSSEYEKVWTDHTIRSMVRMCISNLTILSAPKPVIDFIRELARSDVHFLSEVVQSAFTNPYSEFVTEASKCGKDGPLPSALAIDRIGTRQSAIVAQLHAVRGLIDIAAPPEVKHAALRITLSDICGRLAGQLGHNEVVLENLVLYKQRWFPDPPLVA